LPFGTARLHAKALVVHIVKAQQVAMAEHKALATEDQHGGVCQAGDAAVRKERRARQKVAVAVHEIHGQALRCSLQGRAALGFEAAGFRAGHRRPPTPRTGRPG
jgi:hypothetical protein